MTTIEQAPCTRVVRIQRGNAWELWVARFTGEGVYMRKKGAHSEFGPVSWGTIMVKGAQMAALALVAEQEKPRKKRVSRSLI